MMKENRIMEISAFMDDKEYNVALAGVSGCFTEKLFFWSLVESYSDGWPSETVFHLHTGFLVATRQTPGRLPLWWSALSTSVFLFQNDEGNCTREIFHRLLHIWHKAETAEQRGWKVAPLWVGKNFSSVVVQGHVCSICQAVCSPWERGSVIAPCSHLEPSSFSHHRTLCLNILRELNGKRRDDPAGQT